MVRSHPPLQGSLVKKFIKDFFMDIFSRIKLIMKFIFIFFLRAGWSLLSRRLNRDGVYSFLLRSNRPALFGIPLNPLYIIFNLPRWFHSYCLSVQRCKDKKKVRKMQIKKRLNRVYSIEEILDNCLIVHSGYII